MFSLPPDPHFCPGVLRGGAGGGIQQTQEPLPQPDARRRRHADGALPAAQDRHGGESPTGQIVGNQMNMQAQICPGLNAATIHSSQLYSCNALKAADSCCRINCRFAWHASAIFYLEDWWAIPSWKRKKEKKKHAIGADSNNLSEVTR